jgi:hypothetical protein
MIDTIIGFVLGSLFFVIVRLIVINIREKKGLHAIKYKPVPLRSKLMNMVRQIIFKFSIHKFNRDFLLNLKSNGVHLIQIMHRSHFPEVCENVSDVKFGLAIYIPTKPLSSEQKQKLKQVLEDESEEFIRYNYPVEYFVIDAGLRVRFTGYLIARIIKEVFQRDDVDLELYDEGDLPYHYPLQIAKGQWVV